MADPDQVHAGHCAIVGLPNVGKSTFLNRVLGMRLAAVSDKPQTTRDRLLGVVNLGEPAAQVALVDTPGVQLDDAPLRVYMQAEAEAAAGEADVVLVIVDVTRKEQLTPEAWSAPARAALEAALKPVRAPIVLALNKIDQLKDRAALFPMLEAYHATGRFREVVPISARRGDNVDRLLGLVAGLLPVGPRPYPEDTVTDRSERFLAGELIREQLFHQLGQELPYAAAVVVESFEERSDKKDVLIGAVIVVERDSQKGIVVGKGGARIKQLGIAAREAVSELLGCPVHLNLHVKVVPDWSRGERGIRQLGYEPKAGA
jgi:GTP-binding protein Era